MALRQGLEEPHPEVVFRGHRGAVYSAAYSSDGRLLVTASADGTARIWSADNGWPCTNHSSAGGHRDQRRFQPGRPGGSSPLCTRGGADIWDPATGRRLASPRAPPGKIRAATFSRDGALLGAPAEMTEWFVSGMRRRPTRSTASRCRAAGSSTPRSVRTAGSIIAVGGDQAARTWDLQTGHQGPTLRTSLEAGEMNSAAFSPDGAQVVTTSEGGTGRIWDLRSRTVLGLMWVPGHEMRDASFSRDGSRVVTASFDGVARVWDWAEEARDQTTGDPSLVREFRGPGGQFVGRQLQSRWAPRGRRRFGPYGALLDDRYRPSPRHVLSGRRRPSRCRLQPTRCEDRDGRLIREARRLELGHNQEDPGLRPWVSGVDGGVQSRRPRRDLGRSRPDGE